MPTCCKQKHLNAVRVCLVSSLRKYRSTNAIVREIPIAFFLTQQSELGHLPNIIARQNLLGPNMCIDFIQCRIKLHAQYLNERECTLKITQVRIWQLPQMHRNSKKCEIQFVRDHLHPNMACRRNSLKKDVSFLQGWCQMSKHQHNSLDAQDFIALGSTC